jgi:hypothetical protein
MKTDFGGGETTTGLVVEEEQECFFGSGSGAGSSSSSSPRGSLLAGVVWVLFQICFTTSLLVTVLVTFVLIPAGRKAGVDISFMYNTPSLIMHNLNLVFMVTELAVNRFAFNRALSLSSSSSLFALN